MFKRFGLCVAFIALCMGPVSATSHPAPGQWAISADLLYYLPSFEDTYFVINRPSAIITPLGTKENADFGFKPGFRIGAAYEFCDCDREVFFSYARLSSTHQRLVSGSFLQAFLFSPPEFTIYAGTASADLDLLYQRFDLVYSQGFMNCCGVDVRFQFGLEGDEIHLDEVYVFDNPEDVSTGTSTIDSKTWAIGPEFGFDVDYTFFGGNCGCGILTWHVNSTASLLAARSESSVFEELVAEGTITLADYANEHTWRVVPAAHLKTGLNYDFSYSCVDIALEVGYEFNSYFSGLGRRRGFASTNLTYDNFNVQGFYVSVEVRF